MDKMKWNLDKLYSSFEDDDFQSDLRSYEEMIENINTWTENNLSNFENITSKIENYIKMQKSYRKLLTKLSTFCRLTLSVDSNNSKALNYIESINRKQVNVKKSEVKFKKWLDGIDKLDSHINKSDLLKEHEFYLKERKEQAKYLLSEKEEYVIAKMRTTGSNAWNNLHQKLTSNLKVDIEIDGEMKQLPLSVVRNMYHDEDPKTRKKAYEAEIASYDKIEESAAASLNSIKGEMINLAEMKDYESVIEKTLIQSRLDKKTLDYMLETIEEYLPEFEKFFQKKAEILGHENGLPFYDLFAPLEGFSKKFDYDEAKDFIVKNFSEFSEELSKFAKNAFENNWIDAKPREGKRGGAFCSNIHPIGESRILANFNGEFSNVKTLAHELGHGYHGSILKDESILNSGYPMPLAETASIFCETIVMEAMLEKSEKKEKRALLEKQLTNYGQIIVDIYSRFLFESKVFERRENEILSSDELKNIMLDAQKNAYGDGLDENNLHPYMWVNKPHYYIPGLHYYNFPYAFGLLFAKGVYAVYKEKGDDFIPEYKKLLRATGQNKVAEVASLIDIDINSKEFWRNSLELIKEEIDEFLEL